MTDIVRDYMKRGTLRSNIIDAVWAKDPIDGIKAFDAYDDLIEHEVLKALKGKHCSGCSGWVSEGPMFEGHECFGYQRGNS